MNKILRFVFVATLAALGGCHPYFIHTERQLAGYCQLQTLRLSGVGPFEFDDSLKAFTAQAKKAGVTIRRTGLNTIRCSAVVYQ